MIYRCRKPLHVTDLVVVVSAPDEEVVVALGLPQDAGVVAGVQHRGGGGHRVLADLGLKTFLLK